MKNPTPSTPALSPLTMRPRHRQRGIVLFIALIVLVAMTLAGIALFRQVGTGVTIAGNLAFKENATSVSDMGIESARAWLTAQTSLALWADTTPGYCSSWQVFFDPTKHDWTGGAASCTTSAGTTSSGSQLVTADDGTGNEVRFIIHRLCSCTGDPGNSASCVAPVTQQDCALYRSAQAGASRGGGAYGVLPLANTSQTYFRITVRTAGPRNTVSYIQSVMY